MQAPLTIFAVFVLPIFAAYVQPSTSLESYGLVLESRSDPLLDCLQAGLSKDATVETATAPTFANDTARYSSLFSPNFKAVVKVATEQDVVESVRCASQTNTQFLAISPRHGFAASLTEIQQGLQIDISCFNQVSVDADANTMTIGGAAVFQQAIDALYAEGKEIPTGSCYCVGFLGGTLGAGLGRLAGLHGLMIDSLLSVRMMLPNTTIVEASESQNSDLFWGIRGAGFNYGIVFNATYRVYDQVPNGLHLNADFIFPINQTESYFQSLAQAVQDLPAELAIITITYHDPDSNETVIASNAVYAGPEEQGRAAVQFLVDQNPIRQNISAVPWNNLIQTALFGLAGAPLCTYGPRRSIYGVGLNTIEPSSHLKVASLYQQMIAEYPTTTNSAYQVQVLARQAVTAVPDNATAYPWRQFVAHAALEFDYSDDATNDATTGYPSKIKDAFVEGAGTDGLESYVGYSHGDETVEEIFGQEKLPRLAALKKEIDPDGLFNGYHPLPTAYP